MLDGQRICWESIISIFIGSRCKFSRLRASNERSPAGIATSGYDRREKRTEVGSVEVVVSKSVIRQSEDPAGHRALNRHVG